MINKKPMTAEKWLKSQFDPKVRIADWHPTVLLDDATKALSMAREESRQETAKKIFRELDIARRKGMGFYMRSSEYNLIKAKWVKKE